MYHHQIVWAADGFATFATLGGGCDAVTGITNHIRLQCASKYTKRLLKVDTVLAQNYIVLTEKSVVQCVFSEDLVNHERYGMSTRSAKSLLVGEQKCLSQSVVPNLDVRVSIWTCVYPM